MSAAAEITLREAIDGRWDVIVVGAGPAGAIAARQLAIQGATTLLVERQAWPRQKVCGGCLSGRSVSVLRAIGLEGVLSQTQVVPLSQLTVQARNRRANIRLPGGVAIERSAFDDELVKAAVRVGANFLPATKAIVTEEPQPSEARHVLFTAHGGLEGVATARVVVAADGLGHPSLKRLPEFACHIAEGARVGLSWPIQRLGASYRAGTVYMAISRTGYVGMVRTAEGCGNLAAAIDATALRAADNPVDAVAAILADAGLELPDFSPTDRGRGTLPLTRHAARLSAERIFVLGDAAGYVEPFTGEGIGWALTSAAAATPWIMRNLARWDAQSVSQWEQWQRRQLWHGQTICRCLAGLLRKPWAVQIALGALQIVPALARPLVRRISEPLSAAELRFA